MTIEVAQKWEGYQLNDSQKAWMTGLKPKRGAACCGEADGFPAQDWKRVAGSAVAGTKDHYEVELDGKWLLVNEDALIIEHNPVGVPIVWLTGDKKAVRCFVPGPEN